MSINSNKDWFFEELEVQSRTKINNQKSAKSEYYLPKNLYEKIFSRVFIPQTNNSSFPNESHINSILNNNQPKLKLAQTA